MAMFRVDLEVVNKGFADWMLCFPFEAPNCVVFPIVPGQHFVSKSQVEAEGPLDPRPARITS